MTFDARTTGEIEHRHFYDLPEYLQPGDTPGAERFARAAGAAAGAPRPDQAARSRCCCCATRATASGNVSQSPAARRTPEPSCRFGDGELTADRRRRGGRRQQAGAVPLQGHFPRGTGASAARCRCRRISRSSCRTRERYQTVVFQRPTALPPRRRLGCTSRRSFWKSCRHRA